MCPSIHQRPGHRGNTAAQCSGWATIHGSFVMQAGLAACTSLYVYMLVFTPACCNMLELVFHYAACNPLNFTHCNTIHFKLPVLLDVFLHCGHLQWGVPALIKACTKCNQNMNACPKCTSSRSACIHKQAGYAPAGTMHAHCWSATNDGSQLKDLTHKTIAMHEKVHTHPFDNHTHALTQLVKLRHGV